MELAEKARAVLLSAGEPSTEDDRAQFFELYKMMVASSEALVARRQGVNTFFLTINGLLLTAIGLFVQGDDRIRLQAGGVFVLAIAGLALCAAWRTLLLSFGHLNKGKFTVINEMECHLSAAIFAGEWEALARGEDKRVYRSFTDREADVPFLIGAVHLIAAFLSFAVWVGLWDFSAG
jgi:hypothetical protein